MYKGFFNFERNPFELTPDPTCFVPSKRHNEALAALYYGVRRHKGFVVVTGEVGTGKTLLLRCLLGLLKESKDIAYAYLFNGRLSPTEFLQYILSDFNLPAVGKSKYELLLDLGRFLISRWSQKMTTVLIVDEAHHLSAEILEEVRLLSNLETTDDKLLQIILAGQPELDEKLDSIGLRQLKQRIAVRTQLCPLDSGETKRYIEKRLHIAGATLNARQIFRDETMETVFRHSQGLPRLINTICENALITAYARNSPSVSPEMVDDVAREFRLGTPASMLTEPGGVASDANVEQVLKELLDLYSAPRAQASTTAGILAATRSRTIMSYIFDALQKSEAEHAGNDALQDAEAIELLRNAESRAATTWDSRAKAGTRAEGSQDAAVVAAVSVMGTADVFDEMRLLNVSPPKDNRLVTLTQAESSAAEAFRLLSVRLRHLQRELAIKKLLITSTIPQEGKSVVSANLACTLALKGEQKVLLLEGDLRRPTLMRSFGLSGNPGLCECFQDGRPLGTCIYQLKDTGIWILPAGQVTNSAPNLLQSEWLSPIMDRLNVWFDWIIIDSPPVLPLADTSVWARLADGIILVTRQGVTDKRDLRTGVEGLDRQKLIGAVLNCSRNAAHSDYYYGAPTRAESDSERDW